jgi:hypothetical protein
MGQRVYILKKPADFQFDSLKTTRKEGWQGRLQSGSGQEVVTLLQGYYAFPGCRVVVTFLVLRQSEHEQIVSRRQTSNVPQPVGQIQVCSQKKKETLDRASGSTLQKT